MNLEKFRESLSAAAPPANYTVLLAALWYDANGNWGKAHALVDQLEDTDACRVHAYLHRKEGDQWNAGYWYKKAGEQMPAIELDKERELLVSALS